MEKVLAANEKSVSEYKSGKEKALQFLMGLFYFHEPLEIHRLIAFGFIWVGVLFTIWQNLKEMKKM